MMMVIIIIIIINTINVVVVVIMCSIVQLFEQQASIKYHVIAHCRECEFWNITSCATSSISNYCTIRAPVFGRNQFFGTSEHYGKAHGILLSGWINYYYTACCWFPTSSNICILPSQFWQIRFESYWLHCSKCRILVLLRYVNYTFIYHA